MNLPLSTKELSSWLPHRPPMVWVDRVTAVTEGGGAAEVDLDPKRHFFAEKGLRPSSLIEFCAQAYGYVRAAEEMKKDEPAPEVTQAFLAGVNQLTWSEDPLPTAGTLTIEVETTRQVGPLSLCRAKVTHQGREILSLTLKLFASA